MKTRRTIPMMVVALMMMTGLAFAGETAMNMAKKELYHEITDCFKEEIKDWNNYFYQHDINKFDEKVQVCFIVNGDQSLSLIRLRSDDNAAKDYVKHIFKTKKLKADKVLVGEAYVFNLSVRYNTN
ncbi:hypothetical protein [Sunxiuqinia sp. sy24]|uniref:hypothetical protein n=1 Tax=Sunxiuqinia sp. sy24 TaxID=3461495 RepID=UPI004046811A